MKKELAEKLNDIGHTILELIKSIVISWFLCLLLYIFLGFIMAAVWEENPNKDLYISICVLILYFISFYVIHEQRRTEPFCSIEESYTPKKETEAYFSKEGKYLFSIYGICAVIMEISFFIFTGDTFNPISFICYMFFPLSISITIPIIRAIVCFALCVVGSISLVLIRTHNLNRRLRK